MTILRAVAVRSPEQQMREAMGFYSETFPRMSANNATIMVSGSVYYMPIFLFGGRPVAKILTENGVVGAGMTLMRFGICNTAAVNLALSADVKAQFNATGDIEVAISYTPPSDGVYLLQTISVGGTQPSLQRGSTAQFGGLFTGATVGGPGRQSGQTDIPGTGAITYSAAAIGYWMAVA